jgi:amidohydrolase
MAYDVEQLKSAVSCEIDRMQDRLIHVSKTIHANPELAFEEFESMALLAGLVEEAGFSVERGVGGLETAFKARYGINGGGPAIAFLAEYDALPELGHACGHNLIGTSATGAALAVRHVMDGLPGSVLLIGTPAEEKGGGKAIMVDNGVFDDVDMAMMVHPATKSMTTRLSLASNQIEFEFFGRAAHAAAAPDLGINALDACIQTFNNINALRQHLPDDVRIHGIITHGGDAPNIVPEYAAARFSVRASTSQRSLHVVEKVVRCAEAGAMAAGAQLKVTRLYHYATMIPNRTMAQLFADNITRLGENVQEPDVNERMGSTDMGNVSQIVPCVHPYFTITNDARGHTVEFREAAVSERGHAGMLRATKAMAMTAVELLANPDLAAQVRQEFETIVGT